jgi:hypothetical protein
MLTFDNFHDDYYLTRPQASELAKSLGLHVSPQTLAKLHCVSSEGPPTVRFGRKARIRCGDFRAWLEARISPARRSTSEHPVR